MFMALLIGPAHAQEVIPPIADCGLHPTITWDANKEPDMSVYHIYSALTPNVMEADTTPQVVSHLGKNIPVNSTGENIHTHDLFIMPEGPLYFGVTAVDKAGNESDLSTVVGCMVKTSKNREQATETFSLGLTILGDN